MPTIRKRYQVTETDPVKDALSVAAQRWPDLSDQPSALLVALIVAGRTAIEGTIARRLAAIEATAGSLSESFPAGYLDEMRQDWPE
ncbi:Uncharacterised protein [Mycobacteroides abscessus subsp. massiliense]|uniref:hypothetical protein n=1 Tax=Mycobacteroides abscessus TaxID=36809 RepID=UPI0009A6C40F|nr:hypothetical protein [Mycobacteroides abscessus]SLE83395.1 Uncharacterised protein [Mycobacteroides abscessus subsp. massiliense]